MAEQGSESVRQVEQGGSVEAEKPELDKLGWIRDEGQRYQNEEVSFKWRRGYFCLVLYEEVMVTKEVVNKIWKQTLRSVAKTLSVPGFRKGKAPPQLVAQRYKERVEKEWRHEVVDYVLKVCQSLDTSSTPSNLLMQEHKVYLLSLDTGAILTFVFVTYPSIPKIDLDTLTLGERRVSGTIEKAKEIFLQHVQWLQGVVRNETRREDQTIGEGMLAKIRLHISDSATNLLFLRELCLPFSPLYMPQWLKEALTGLTVGTTTEFCLLNWSSSFREGGNTNPGDWQEQFVDHITSILPDRSDEEMVGYLWHISQIEGSPLHFRLSLLDILSPSPVDLKLAESLGKGSIEELHHSLTQALVQEKEEFLKVTYRDQMAFLLIDRYAFDLPIELILREYWARFRDCPSPPPCVLGSNKEEVERRWIYDRVVDTERSLRLSFLITAMQKENELPPLPPPPEPLRELVAFMRSEKVEENSLEREASESQGTLRENILWRRAYLDFLISEATIVSPAEAPLWGKGEGSTQFPQLLTKRFDVLKPLFILPKNPEEKGVP